MRFHRSIRLTNWTTFLGVALSALYLCYSKPAFSQSISAYSNQASLDLETPQRFKPVVGLEMGVLWMSRSAPDPQDIVFDDNGAVLLNANQLQGDMGAGLDSTLNLHNFFSEQSGLDVQLRYFQVADMLTQQTITATQVIPLFYNGIPATPSTTNDINYESKIRSFEANLVARTPYRLRFLAGFRFFEVDEIYDVIDAVSSSPTQSIGFFSRSENTMAGGQIGTEATLWTNHHSRLFGSFKWALLSNDVVGTASASDTSGNPLQADAFDSISCQLFDFQLGSSICLSHWFSIYGGYQGLVASDVALALEQSRNASLFAGLNPIFDTSTQWHGFKITGIATW